MSKYSSEKNSNILSRFVKIYETNLSECIKFRHHDGNKLGISLCLDIAEVIGKNCKWKKIQIPKREMAIQQQ